MNDPMFTLPELRLRLRRYEARFLGGDKNIQARRLLNGLTKNELWTRDLDIEGGAWWDRFRRKKKELVPLPARPNPEPRRQSMATVPIDQVPNDIEFHDPSLDQTREQKIHNLALHFEQILKKMSTETDPQKLQELRDARDGIMRDFDQLPRPASTDANQRARPPPPPPPPSQTEKDGGNSVSTTIPHKAPRRPAPPPTHSPPPGLRRQPPPHKVREYLDRDIAEGGTGSVVITEWTDSDDDDEDEDVNALVEEEEEVDTIVDRVLKEYSEE